MENPGTERARLEILRRHVSPSLGEQSTSTMLEREVTAGEFFQEAQYSVVLPEKLLENKWNVYRSAQSPLKLVDSFPEAHIRNLHDNFEHAVATYGSSPCFGSRVRPNGTVGKYEWITYKEAGEARTAVGSSLAQYGIQKGDRVGLYFHNRTEWVVTDLACMAYGFVSVPLYDTLGADAAQYIINHAEISAVFCTRDKLSTVVECLPHCPSVRMVVVVGGSEQMLPLPPAAQSSKPIPILPFSRLEAQGRVNPRPFSPLDPDELVSICYTSGTTGVPKGAMLTHRGMVASSAGACHGALLQPGDVYLSYLPLAHVYERLNIVGLIHFGAAIGFNQGDILKIMEDLEELKPTIFSSVPRLYNRIYDKILATVKASGGLREYLFNVAFNAKRTAMEKGKQPSPVWDRLVFNKIKAKLGGRVRIMTTGASPISQEVFDFLKICFGARVVEGYGLTETTSAATTMDEGDNTSGHVGSPVPSCEVKLADVPEMEYMSSDRPNPRGEICIRGPQVFKGYYKDEEKTAEILDADGWLHTGDIGMWLPGGRLKIIDRKKNIFKLAQGEYIAPEKIENVYQTISFVAQIFVHGDSLNSALVAIVVVDPDAVTAWAKSRGMSHPEDVAALCKDPVTKAAVLAEMDKAGQESKLRGFECVKAVHLVVDPFTQENGLLTPTFKVKRPQAKNFFEKEIADMYDELKKKETEQQSRLQSRL
eukprot:TRINITY_DN4485_c0_g1_i1.p1 TRINITY_DN4485_c0_g1~~TRINITY_DN4485_c0_g1_i1.p1  ORF type:complete len:707 (-),score=147.37 TRINITY_DN4485_c0_g1_i1:806-2926(-)